MGDKLGRVHMEKQDFTKLQTRKMKGLKKSSKSEKNQDGEDEDDEDVGMVHEEEDVSMSDSE